MNNVGKPALYGLTQPTVGTFFRENHLNTMWDGPDAHPKLCSLASLRIRQIYVIITRM
jgi:hypothetical protein